MKKLSLFIIHYLLFVASLVNRSTATYSSNNLVCDLEMISYPVLILVQPAVMAKSSPAIAIVVLSIIATNITKITKITKIIIVAVIATVICQF